MENRKKTKLVLRPTTTAVKIMLIVLVVFSIMALGAVQLVSGQLRQQTEEKRQEAAALEQENAALESRTTDIDSVGSIKDIAESELGLVNPDAVIIGEE